MNRRRGWVGVIVAGVLALSAWAYALLLLYPAIDPARPPGEGLVGPYRSDFYPRWLGSRELLWHGRDPYSAEVTREIQLGFYGIVLTPDSPIQDQQGFAYPLYTAFLVAPLTLLPFDVVKPLFYALAVGLTGVSVLGWIAGLGWRLPRRDQGFLVLLGVSTMAEFMVVYTQQPAVIVVALLAGVAACLVRGTPTRLPQAAAPGAGRANGWYILAGGLLALATIKPQLSLIMTVWLLGWAALNWRQRVGLLLGFGLVLGALSLGAFLLLPGWLGEWLAALTNYQGYALTAPAPGQSTSSPLLLAVLAGGGVLLLALAWRTRQAAPGSLGFSLMLAVTGLYTLILFPAWTFYHQLILYPAALLLLQHRATLQAVGRLGRPIYRIMVALLAAPYLLALGLLLVWGASLALGSAAQQEVARYWAWPWITGFVGWLVLVLPLGLLVWAGLRPAGPPPG